LLFSPLTGPLLPDSGKPAGESLPVRLGVGSGRVVSVNRERLPGPFFEPNPGTQESNLPSGFKKKASRQGENGLPSHPVGSDSVLATAAPPLFQALADARLVPHCRVAPSGPGCTAPSQSRGRSWGAPPAIPAARSIFLACLNRSSSRASRRAAPRFPPVPTGSTRSSMTAGRSSSARMTKPDLKDFLDFGFRLSLDLRLFVQHRIQQRIVHFDVTVVADEAELAELVHEEAHAGSRGADHFG